VSKSDTESHFFF